MRYSGNVIAGKGRGKQMGFPTLNLSIPDPLPYTHGIYAGWVWIDGARHPGAFHFGPIPVFREQKVSLEVFVIDTILEKIPVAVEFELVVYLRAIEHFADTATLAAQIKKDVERTRKILDSRAAEN